MNVLRLLLGIIGGGVLALGQSSVALANGGHVHLFGDVGIPYVVAWIGGGMIVAFFLFFLIGWGLSSRARKLSQQGETEGNPSRAEEKE